MLPLQRRCSHVRRSHSFTVISCYHRLVAVPRSPLLGVGREAMGLLFIMTISNVVALRFESLVAKVGAAFEVALGMVSE